MSVEPARSSEFKISVCSLCRDDISAHSLYQHIRPLFSDDAEFLLITNSKHEWDCYSAMRHFLQEAQGDLIIITHDDIRFGELSLSLLLKRISEVSSRDPTAALFGIAGISRKGHKGVGHFHDASGEQLWGFYDGGQASSLDECFLVINRSKGINVSDDLSGYHFYGTDLCLNAMRSGLSCYAIDYPLIHQSAGSLNENFFTARDCFEKHLEKQGLNRFIKTTCTVFYGKKNWLLQCWALASSHVLLETPRHRDFDLASRCITERGGARYGCYTLALMIRLCRFNAQCHRFFSDVIWWIQNWRFRIPGGGRT